MRAKFGVIVIALAAAGCGSPAPHDYPAALREEFAEGCPAGDPLCDCSWERITRTLSPEEYVEARARFREEGLMDPRLTAARAECREKVR